MCNKTIKMKKKSVSRQITESLNSLVSNKIKEGKKYLLAKEIFFVVDGEVYEYESNTNGLYNQSYYNRNVNIWLKAAMFKQASNKSFGMPFPDSSPLARVIYIGEF